MERIEVNDKVYGVIINFKADDKLRNSFNKLTRKIYKFDFEDWYQSGYWNDRYIPYSIVDGDTIVSNVSVNIIDFMIEGVKRTCIQIGTVMTDIAYRNQGLNRILMNRVLEDWKGKCDLIYLFANDSVLDFYPKFGFNSTNEYQHSKEFDPEEPRPDYTKLNMSDKENEVFLIKKVNKSLPFSEISMVNNTSLILFYCTTIMSENVYYIEKYDAIIIAEINDTILYINDIFCEREVLISDIILSLINKEIKKVILGFTPKDTTSFDEILLKQEDTTLFVLDDKLDLFDNNKIRFPILSHA